MKIFHYAVILTTLLWISLPHAFALEKNTKCPLYQRIAEEIVPIEIGNREFIQKLVQVKKGPDFLAQFPDICPPPREFKKLAPNLGFCEVQNLTLRYNKNKGEVKFFDRGQLFDLEKSPRIAVSEEKGLQAIIPFFSIIGNIFTEADFTTYTSDILMGAGGSQRETKPSTVFEAERHYRIGRKVNGVPVEGSRFFAAVSNRGIVSKFRIRWPQFQIAPSIQDKFFPIDRKEVVNNVYKAMTERSPQCKKLKIYDAYIAYIPKEKDRVEDQDNILYEESQSIVYVPQLVVRILTESDTEAGDEFLVDIVEESGNEDNLR